MRDLRRKSSSRRRGSGMAVRQRLPEIVENGSECSAINLRGHHPAVSNPTDGTTRNARTDCSARAITCCATRDVGRKIPGRSRFTANTSVHRSCHISTDHPRNVTCHKPERCGLFPLDMNTISRSSKGDCTGVIDTRANCTTKGLTGIKMFNATSYSVVESEVTRCHELSGRGDCVTTRHSATTGEHQSGVHSIKLWEMFNQVIKN